MQPGFSPIMGLMVLSGHIVSENSNIKFKVAKIRASFIKSIIMLGIPSFVAEMSSGIVIFVFNIIILDLQGNVGVAAYGVIANLALVVFQFTQV